MELAFDRAGVRVRVSCWVYGVGVVSVGCGFCLIVLGLVLVWPDFCTCSHLMMSVVVNVCWCACVGMNGIIAVVCMVLIVVVEVVVFNSTVVVLLK